MHSSAPDPCATLNLGWGSVLHLQASSFVRSARHGPCGWPIPSVSESVPSIHPSIHPSIVAARPVQPPSQPPGPRPRAQSPGSPEPRVQSPEGGDKERERLVGKVTCPKFRGPSIFTHPSYPSIHPSYPSFIHPNPGATIYAYSTLLCLPFPTL